MSTKRTMKTLALADLDAVTGGTSFFAVPAGTLQTFRAGSDAIPWRGTSEWTGPSPANMHVADAIHTLDTSTVGRSASTDPTSDHVSAISADAVDHFAKGGATEEPAQADGSDHANDDIYDPNAGNWADGSGDGDGGNWDDGNQGDDGSDWDDSDWHDGNDDGCHAHDGSDGDDGWHDETPDPDNGGYIPPYEGPWDEHDPNEDVPTSPTDDGPTDWHDDGGWGSHDGSGEHHCHQHDTSDADEIGSEW